VAYITSNSNFEFIRVSFFFALTLVVLNIFSCYKITDDGIDSLKHNLKSHIILNIE